MRHVYFWAVPLRVMFMHKGEWYRKVGPERAEDRAGRSWLFEVHWGCLLPKRVFHAYSMGAGAVRP